MNGRFTQLLAPRDLATAFGGPEGRLIPLPGGPRGCAPSGAAQSAGGKHRNLHEKRPPTTVDDLFSWR